MNTGYITPDRPGKWPQDGEGVSVQEEYTKRIRDTVMKRLDFSQEVSDAQVLDLIDEEILRASEQERILVEERKQIRQEVFHSIRKLDVLQDLVDDPRITEIMINGPDSIFVEREGRICQIRQHFPSKERLSDVIQQIIAGCNRVVNESVPIADARLENGARVNVVLAPAALNGPILTIRRFPDHPIEMSDLIGFGSISPYMAEYLGALVAAGYNIFISGGTGSGKTTFLNALSAYIPADERVITVEDNAELQLRHIPNLVRLEARNANVDGCMPISIRDLIRTSLRMRPDRIIVGEVRGGEAIDMIQAMNTGHDGSMSTGHANSASDMMSRLETMVLMGMELPLAAIQAQIISAIDIVVHLGRLRDRSRKVMEVAEMVRTSSGSAAGVSCDSTVRTGEIRLRTLFRFVEKGEENGRITGEWVQEGELEGTAKLSLAGIRLPG